MLQATVSHEMRTPINIMMGLIGSLGKYVLDPKGQKLISVLQISAKMLQYLVQDMLDIYLIKNGKFKRDDKPVDIV